MDNLNAVKEMVLDEDKLVTYISISKELCIHVNTSKMLLEKVVQSIRQDKPNLNLNVIFLISGLTNSNVARVTVCPESELVGLRSTFKVVHFEHIYSISKGAIDNILLVNNNYDDFNLCSGSIKNSFCVKHSSSEINNLKSSSLVVSETSSNKSIPPHKKVKVEVQEKLTNGESSNQGNNAVKHTDMKIKKEQQSPKKESPSPRKENRKQSNQKINGINKTQKGIAGFFGKPSNTSKKSTPEVSKNGLLSESEVKIEKMEVDQVKSETAPKCYTNTNKTNKKLESKNDDKKTSPKEDKNKILNEIKKSSRVDKKRKRVLHVSDSESEDRSDTEKDIQEPIQDSDDEIPPTPMTNNIKITSGMVNPKKKRKVIDKTFQDDEGYILTKKVEVYESCSDEENVPEAQTIPEPKVKEVKKETSPKSNAKSKSAKKKITSPQKGKQATLMNFFKRK
ncbi:DNA polymerase delta subunit 3-like [Aricia agestis]|uniref:DNA polymerase delta subunit 3-like n=1 Tax=Aricia agestis TaxID=91739 RepID=UPI001C2083FE|nr:DNA polymerase delta subunit 3-like [Aricia agestis]